MALTRTRVRVEGIVQGSGSGRSCTPWPGGWGWPGWVEGAAETVERFLEALAPRPCRWP